MAPEHTVKARWRRRKPWALALLTAVMVGFGFALAPLYDMLCQITGLNGRSDGMLAPTTSVQTPDVSREVTVQFLTTVNSGAAWGFKAAQQEIKVHPGQFYTVNFEATNQLSEPTVGQAVPAVTPGKAAKHVKKTEGFFFNQPTFKANRKKQGPGRRQHAHAPPKDVTTVTLAYTFFDMTTVASNRKAESASRAAETRFN